MNAVIQELFSPALYKRTQGRIARQVTFAALAVTLLFGCWQLVQQWQDQDTWLHFGVPGAMLLVGLWVCYRVVNVPRFADFLISVEAEMSKVSWPTRQELVRSALVVLIVIFVLATVLFGYDLFWQFLLYDLLEIGGPKLPPAS